MSKYRFEMLNDLCLEDAFDEIQARDDKLTVSELVEYLTHNNGEGLGLDELYVDCGGSYGGLEISFYKKVEKSESEILAEDYDNRKKQALDEYRQSHMEELGWVDDRIESLEMDLQDLKESRNEQSKTYHEKLREIERKFKQEFEEALKDLSE